MKYIDLHIHSIFSDGNFSPLDILLEAKDTLNAFSISDHDAIEGCRQAYEEAVKYGIKVISGIEFSTYDDRSVHVLGYNVDMYSGKLVDYCKLKKKENARELTQVLKGLHSNGINISLEELKKDYRRVNVKNIVAYLVHKKICSCKDEAIKTCYRYFEDSKRPTDNILGTKDCIKFIHDLGGIAILAHPMLLTNDYEALERRIEVYKEWGLDGLECIHPKHSEKDIAWCKRIALKHGMLITGGSDFHGNESGKIELSHIDIKDIIL